MSSLIEVPSFLAQAAAPAAPSFDIRSLIPMALIGVAFYFLLIAPQRKKQKEQQKMLDALGTGDEVITAGGIYGEITNKKDDRFVIRIAEGTKIEVAKAFITTIVKKAG